jgi:hypothetical protein
MESSEKKAICKNCKFCKFVMYKNDNPNYYIPNEYICQFMPTPVKKSPDDWCGQYKERHI